VLPFAGSNWADAIEPPPIPGPPAPRLQFTPPDVHDITVIDTSLILALKSSPPYKNQKEAWTKAQRLVAKKAQVPTNLNEFPTLVRFYCNIIIYTI
jgi:hypothetical protein